MMVASKNRMFRTETGRIVTLQDVIKAGGVISDSMIPANNPEYKGYSKEEKDAMDNALKSAIQEALLDPANKKDLNRVLAVTEKRVGYKTNTEKLGFPGVSSEKEKEIRELAFRTFAAKDPTPIKYQGAEMAAFMAYSQVANRKLEEMGRSAFQEKYQKKTKEKAPATKAAKPKKSDYSDFSQRLAKTKSRKEIDSEILKLEKELKKGRLWREKNSKSISPLTSRQQKTADYYRGLKDRVMALNQAKEYQSRFLSK